MANLAYRPHRLNEVELAQTFAAHFQWRLAYVPEHNVWNLYDEGTGRWMSVKEPLDAAMQFARAMLGEAEDYDKAVSNGDSEAYLAFARNTNSLTRIKALIALAAPRLTVSAKAFDADPHIINTPLGVIDLRTGATGPHAPQYFCTRSTPVPLLSIDHQEACWTGFIDAVTCGDITLALYLQVLMGSALVGQVFQEGVAFFCGAGANGKSTLVSAVQAALGDYARTVTAELLTKRPGVNVGANVAVLEGTRLAITGELERGDKLCSAAVKRLTSTDEIVAEPKYKTPYTFTPTHTLVAMTNFLPELDSHDHGTLRRIHVVPFSARFDGDGAIPNFAKYLFENAGPAILEWLVEGAKMFLDNGCTLPYCAAVDDATERYTHSRGPLYDFIADRCQKDPNAKVSASALRQAYVAWARASGLQPVPYPVFNQALERLGFWTARPGNLTEWHGLALA